MQPSRDPTTEMDVRRDRDAVEKVHDIIAKTQFAMFGTYDAQGACHSRPMAAVDQDRAAGDDALWFFARTDSRKVAEIGADPRVSIDYADSSGQNYVSVLGRAAIVRDRAKIEALWMEVLRTWFPDGPGDDTVALIRVDMEAAEYWDSPSSLMVHAFGYVKARVTGEPPSPGDVAQVRM